MTKKITPGRGGKRAGSGRKPGPPTTLINFRIDEDLAFMAKGSIPDLNRRFVVWLKDLLKRRGQLEKLTASRPTVKNL